jgi:photoactive yellow protein
MTFDLPQILTRLQALDGEGLDALDFGVIAFDAAGVVRRYSACESRHSGLSPEHVLGRHLFKDVAPCMNNHLVARRFEAAADAGQGLDDTIDYLLTWRMRPTRIRLRLLQGPGGPLSYLLLIPADRSASPAPGTVIGDLHLL